MIRVVKSAAITFLIVAALATVITIVMYLRLSRTPRALEILDPFSGRPYVSAPRNQVRVLGPFSGRPIAR